MQEDNTSEKEIKIERNLFPDVKENIFVAKPGTGRNHCLMGIHLVGKSTLVSDWAIQWSKKRKKNINDFLTSAKSKTPSIFFQKEKNYKLQDLPEMAKIFYFEDQIFEISFSKIGKVLTEIKNTVLVCQSEKPPFYYEKKKENYIIKTGDGFCVCITDKEQKRAVEDIERVYTYLDSSEDVFSKEHCGKTTDEIKKLFRAFTILGFHIILIFDEFNNSKTMKRTGRHRQIVNSPEPEGKEEFLNLLRELYPFAIEGGAMTKKRQYNVSVLIVSRQEMGMITGDEEDNDLYAPCCLDGFSNGELEEYISQLKNKMRKDGILPYPVVSAAFGEKNLNQMMLHYCGRQPGLWGYMWNILNMTYEAHLQDKNMEVIFEVLFKEKSKDFFQNVIALMNKTKERIDNRTEISALKIFIHHFVERHQYPIPNDDGNRDLIKYLEMMEKQGFVSSRDAANSFQVLQDKIERGMSLKEKYTFEISDEIKLLLGYEMHSPYFTDYIKSHIRECYGYDKVDLENASEECELKVRELLKDVYKKRYGEDKWLVKLKNRMTDVKKQFWYTEVCKYNEDKAVPFAQREKQLLSVHSPWESLSYSDYGDLLKMYRHIFEKVLEIWVENNTFSDALFNKDLIRMAEIRNTIAHRKAYDSEKLKEDIEVCIRFLKGIQNGYETALKRAGEISLIEEENVLDLYDVEFVCTSTNKHTIVGTIEYNQKSNVAKIPKANVTRKVQGKGNKFIEDENDTFFEDLFIQPDTIKVDVVKCCKENNGTIYYVVQPVERSGLQVEWTK